MTGTHQDSGTFSGDCSQGIRALRQLLWRLQKTQIITRTFTLVQVKAQTGLR